MKRYFIFFLAALATLSIQSCKDETSEWLDRIPVFRVNAPAGTTEDNEINIDGKSQTVDFTVYASNSWSAEVSGCDAYSFNTSVGGSGKTVISLLTPENESEAVREATVSFYLGEVLKDQFTVIQQIQEPYIDLSETEVTLTGYENEFTIDVLSNQESWNYIIETEGASEWIVETAKSGSSVSFSVPENTSGKDRSASLLFTVDGKPELFAVLTINQLKPATPPTDLILDVIFNEDGTAYDASPMKMTVDASRRDSDVVIKKLTDFGGRYAAAFTNPTVARSSLKSGYYMVPYAVGDSFANKIADGVSYELVFCTYYDPLTYTDGLKQTKPFASTDAGGIGVCLKANSGVIQLETHVGGGWKSPASDVVPVPNRYYHVIGVWDKAAGVSTIYVDGEYKASVNAAGDFKFMNTTVDKRWFGIGADPGSDDTGQISFYGEVVIARLYDAPMSAAEVAALYRQLNK